MTDDQRLEDIRAAFDEDQEAWREIREEGDRDMLCVSGDVPGAVDPKGKQARIDAKRMPLLSLDEIGQYVNQLINEIRSNKRGAKVTPIGSGANDKTAEFRQNRIRQIEYRSNANRDADAVMFENAVHRGYGFERIRAKYISTPDEENPQPSDFDQELLIDPIVNPNLVTPDKRSVRADGSDMRRCTLYEVMGHDEFKREYKGAAIKNFTAEHQTEAPAWVRANEVIVGEHWTIDTRLRKLLLIAAPQSPNGVRPLWEDAFKKLRTKPEVRREREVQFPSVRQYFTNGVEILSKTDWPGFYIPIVCCYGKVIYVTTGAQTKRIHISLPRLARDPAMLYCYYRTQEAEVASGVPKAPVQAYEGQMEGYEDRWEKAAHEPVAFLYFKGKTDATGDQVLPPPQRIPYTPGEHLQALEICAEGARRAIQAAMGISPLPTAAQRRNEKSGKALDRMQYAEQKGSFHFIDHYDAALSRRAVILDDLIPHYDDTARDVTVRRGDDMPEIIRINDPENPDSIDVTQGQHDVTLSVGQSYDSEREAASDFADSLMQSPEMIQKIGDLVVKLKNLGPIGDEIAERLTPPAFRKPKDGASDPAQLQQDLAQAQGLLQQHQEAVAKLQQIVQTDQVKGDTQIKIKQMDLDFQREKSARENETKLAVAELGAKVDRLTLFLEERERLGLQREAATDRLHEALENEKDRQHAAGMAQMGHQQTLEQGDQAHQQALEQGEQAGAQQMALTEQQAAQQAAGEGAGV